MQLLLSVGWKLNSSQLIPKAELSSFVLILILSMINFIFNSRLSGFVESLPRPGGELGTFCFWLIISLISVP